MCHALLQDPHFFHLLLRIDEELAATTRATGCPCGGALHRAHYPRKPRGCPPEVRADFERRFSFCCSLCRKRATSKSVRFLGRRVHLGLVVVLGCARHAGHSPAATRVGQRLKVSPRTLARWRQWWRLHFPQTPLWQAAGARFMPPLDPQGLPAALLARFTGPPSEALMRCLLFLTPLSVAAPVAFDEGR